MGREDKDEDEVVVDDGNDDDGGGGGIIISFTVVERVEYAEDRPEEGS